MKRAAFLMALFIALPAFGQSGAGRLLEKRIERVVGEVESAIVAIHGREREDHPFGGLAGPMGPVTGFLVGPEGWVLTTGRNLGPEKEPIVELADGRRFDAAIVGRDFRTGLRLLKLERDEKGEELPFLSLTAASPARPGQFAIAVGATFREGRPSANLGIVSGVERLSGMAIQTDANIHPGNTGGPLVDLDGRVLGVCSLLDRRTGVNSGVGFAVAGNRIAPVLERLKKGETLEPAFLGVELAEESNAAAMETGIEITKVLEGTAASAAALRPGDEIQKLGRRVIRTAYDVKRTLAPLTAGDRLFIKFRRSGRTIEKTIQLGNRP